VQTSVVSIFGMDFELRQWERGDPVITGDCLAVDTETELLISGAPIKPVTCQVCDLERRVVEIATYPYFDEYVEALFGNNPSTTWLMHNAAFDVNVCGRLPSKWLVRALDSGKLIDTAIRFILHTLQDGIFVGTYGLDYAVKIMTGYTIPKDDELRLQFKQGVALRPDQLQYAVTDPVATALLASCMQRQYPTEDVQLRGAMALHWCSLNGLLVDRDYMQQLTEKLQANTVQAKRRLTHWGWHPGRSGNAGVLQTLMQFFEQQAGITLPRTEVAGTIKVGKEAKLLFPVNQVPAFIDDYVDYKHDEKVLTTYLNPEYIGADGRVHSYFAPLVKTGRTSSARPNVQNPPKKGGIRGIYMAPPGTVLCSTDYNQIELCALAQSCYTRFGYSRMREIINEGTDLHTFFGREICRSNGVDPDTLKDKEFKTLYRSYAKVLNFGKPGGLGATKLVTTARNSGIELTVDKAKELIKIWLETFPEMVDHLKPQEDPAHYGFYVASTIHGRYRSCATYNAACNYP